MTGGDARIDVPTGPPPPAATTNNNKDSRSFRPNSLEEMNVANNYRPLVCGNSARDIVLIVGCYVAFYSLAVAFFVLLLRGALDTDVRHTLLWSFFFFGVMFASLVGGAVHVGMAKAERQKKERRVEKVERAKAAAAGGGGGTER